MAGVREMADQKLRDWTIAVAVAGVAGVGVIALVSAATIPGSTGTTGTSGLTGNAATNVEDQASSQNGIGFSQAPPASTQFGPGVAVSGGSH
jgi:hypothetical protein